MRIKSGTQQLYKKFVNLFPTEPLKLVLVLSAINVTVITLAVQLGIMSEYNDPGRYFREGRIMTWISFFQLLAIAEIAASIYRKRQGEKYFKFGTPTAIWKIFSIGFIFLAIDEIARVHEAIDRYSHKLFNAVPTDLTDRFDDLIVLFYGLIGLACIFRYREELWGFRKSLIYFALGFTLFLVMAGMDLLFNGDTLLINVVPDTIKRKQLMNWLNTTEDIFKIFAEICFIGGYLKCLIIAEKFSPAGSYSIQHNYTIISRDKTVHSG